MTREEFIQRAVKHLESSGIIGIDKETANSWGFTMDEAEQMILEAFDASEEGSL